MPKNNFLPLIMENKVSELTKMVFNQKLTAGAKSSFVEPLSEEEENSVLKQLFAADNNIREEWLVFVKEYLQHYPGFISTDRILVNNLANSDAVYLIVISVSRYGYTNEIGSKICDYAATADEETQVKLLSLLCENGRIFYADIHDKLESIDMRRKEKNLPDLDFAKSYIQGISSYRELGGVLGHTG